MAFFNLVLSVTIATGKVKKSTNKLSKKSTNELWKNKIEHTPRSKEAKNKGTSKGSKKTYMNNHIRNRSTSNTASVKNQ